MHKYMNVTESSFSCVKKSHKVDFNFLIPIGIVICRAIYHPKKGIQGSFGFRDSRNWIPIFLSGTWFLDSNLYWDSGFHSPVFHIQPAKISWILVSSSKSLPDSGIRIPYMGQYLVQLKIEGCEANTEYKLTYVYLEF